MAGMSGRFSTVIKAKINRMLDKAEDPAETLEYSYQKQMELLQNVKKGIADVVTSKKRLQLQQQKLEQQVRQAGHAGPPGARAEPRGSRARRAGAQAVRPDRAAGRSTRRSQELETQQQSLVDKEAQAAYARSTSSAPRRRSSRRSTRPPRPPVKISEAASGVGEEMADVGMAMQRAVDKTENMRARANAMDELEASGAFDDQLSLTAGSGRHRPPAARADLGLGRRRRPRAAAGRARPGHRRRRRRSAPATASAGEPRAARLHQQESPA